MTQASPGTPLEAAAPAQQQNGGARRGVTAAASESVRWRAGQGDGKEEGSVPNRRSKGEERRRGGPFRRARSPSLPVCGTFCIRVKGVAITFCGAVPAPWVTAAPASTQGPFHLTICWSPDVRTCPGRRRRVPSTDRLAAPGPERPVPPPAGDSPAGPSVLMPRRTAGPGRRPSAGLWLIRPAAGGAGSYAPQAYHLLPELGWTPLPDKCGC